MTQDSPLELIARQAFEAQPFSQFLGARLKSVGDGTAEISLPLTDALKQQHGFAHGGVLSYLADNSLAFAGGLALRCDVLVSGFEIKFVRPARGEKLIARAQAVFVGKRQAVCSTYVSVVSSGEERICAIAQGSVRARPFKD